MPSPYPGIDPQIERQGHWPGFHLAFMANCQSALIPLLPDGYDVRLERRLTLETGTSSGSDDADGGGEGDRQGTRGQDRVADVEVAWQPGSAAAGAGTAVAVAPDAATARVLMPARDPLRQTFAKVTKGDDVVTVIELLSPANKGGRGYRAFRQRHEELLAAGFNVVELDLLLRGRRSPATDTARLREHDGYAVVTLAQEPTEADVWAFTLKDRLPRIPVPLKPADGHVVLDVGAVYAETYDRGGFARRLKYDDVQRT